jgi:hypothetical protein
MGFGGIKCRLKQKVDFFCSGVTFSERRSCEVRCVVRRGKVSDGDSTACPRKFRARCGGLSGFRQQDSGEVT